MAITDLSPMLWRHGWGASITAVQQHALPHRLSGDGGQQRPTSHGNNPLLPRRRSDDQNLELRHELCMILYLLFV